MFDISTILPKSILGPVKNVFAMYCFIGTGQPVTGAVRIAVVTAAPQCGNPEILGWINWYGTAESRAVQTKLYYCILWFNHRMQQNFLFVPHVIQP